MKLKIFLTTLLFATVFQLAFTQQCSEAILDNTIMLLDNTTYLKDFKVILAPAKKNKPKPCVPHAVILNKGAKYTIYGISKDDFNSKLLFDIYDDGKLIASNYNTKTKKCYKSVQFNCNKTGTYYINFYFENGAAGCGVGVLAYQDQKFSTN